jgi:hypothetical protein
MSQVHWVNTPFHEYEHFEKNRPKLKVYQLEEKDQEQWRQEKWKKSPSKVMAQQQKKAVIHSPSSPNKGKSLMKEDYVAEISINKYATL